MKIKCFKDPDFSEIDFTICPKTGYWVATGTYKGVEYSATTPERLVKSQGSKGHVNNVLNRREFALIEFLREVRRHVEVPNDK